MDSEKATALLTEIRDAQLRFQDEQHRLAKESLAMQKESLSLQHESVERQRASVAAQLRHLRLYRRVLGVSALLIASCIAILIMLP